MTATVWFSDDPFDEKAWSPVRSDDPRQAMFDRFGPSGFPANTRVYAGVVSEETDVTPHDPASVEALGAMTGDIWVVTYPEDPTTLIVAAIAVVAVAATFLFLDVPTPTAASNVRQSSNNSLSRRVNSGRPLQRVPDIFGTVRSTPDLLSLPYRIYEDNIQVEVATMCIGRGSYQVSDVRDGETLVDQIEGASVAVYGPNQSPNAGSTPQLQIGDPIPDIIQIVAESNGVNGQELLPPNAGGLPSVSATAIPYSGFGTAATVAMTLSDGVALSEVLSVGDIVNIPTFPPAGSLRVEIDRGVDIDGRPLGFDFLPLGGDGLQISAIDDAAGTVTFSNATTVQPNWLMAVSEVGVQFPTETTRVEPQNRNEWVGPFQLSPTPSSAGGSSTVELLFNFVARNGLYRRTQGGQRVQNATVEVEISALDENGNVMTTPAPVTQELELDGSSVSTAQRAGTLRVPFGFAPSIQFRARRTSPTSSATNETTIDTIQWEEAYILTRPAANTFGDVTIIQARSAATPQATGLRERRLNLEVSRLIPRYNAQGQIAQSSAVTNRFSDIIIAMTVDPLIGRRTVADINIQSVVAVQTEIDQYFGSTDHSQFSYTFDELDFTYEQSVAAVAQAVFCSAFRQGNVLDLTFDRPNRTPAILFNHRNKVLRSERRTFSFGNVNAFDGVELEFVDPETDVQETFFVPEDRSAINPQRIQTIGVRNRAQARAHAYRARNRQRFQFVSTEFDATGEGNLLTPRDVILVADNTRPQGDDGEIVSATGLTVGTSQPVRQPEPGESLVMHLQFSDRTTGNVPIASVSNDGLTVTLAQAPAQALVTSVDRYAKTTYLVTSNRDERINRFILTDVSRGGSPFESSVTAVQYDDRYYQDDLTGT